MKLVWKVSLAILLIIVIILGIFIYKNYEVVQLYEKAKAKAEKDNKKLLVLGSPTSASGALLQYFTKIYGCGDVCVDMNCCKNCERTYCEKAEDVLHKFESNGYVIFESGLLEVVDEDKLDYIVSEMYRIAGNKENIFASHHIQKHKWYFKHVYGFFYKFIGEGNIDRFVETYPPNNYYTFS